QGERYGKILSDIGESEYRLHLLQNLFRNNVFAEALCFAGHDKFAIGGRFEFLGSEKQSVDFRAPQFQCVLQVIDLPNRGLPGRKQRKVSFYQMQPDADLYQPRLVWATEATRRQGQADAADLMSNKVVWRVWSSAREGLRLTR